MNNWRLLLLAVVAVLQPIESYTEKNLIDGSQECCDHRSNSKTQNTRLYGTFRKITPEERRLSSREDIREERRYEARNDPITRSRENWTQKRVERRISPEFTVRLSTETRFTRDTERRQVEAKETRQREEQNRKNPKSISKNSLNQYERDTLDSRHIKMIRNDARIGIERLQRKSVDSRHADRVQNFEDLQRVSTTRKSIATLGQETNVPRDAVFRDSRIIRKSRPSEQRTRENADNNRRSRSLESRVEELRSRIDSRGNRRGDFRVVFERIDERNQDQNRKSTDRTSDVLRVARNKLSEDRRSEFRDTEQRVDRYRNNNNERANERRQQRDASRMSRESSTAAELRQLQTRIIDANARSDERKLAMRDTLLRRSRINTMERRQNAGVSRMLEATSRNERLVRSNEKQEERRQTVTRSLDQVFVLASSDLNERIINSRNAIRFAERNIRNDRAARYQRELNSAETLTENREQRELRESRDTAERRQATRRTVSLTRFEADSRSDRELRIRENQRDNTRFDANRREYQERRAVRNQDLGRITRNTGRINDVLTRTSRFSERTDERISRRRENVQKERSDLLRSIHSVDQDSREDIFTQRLTRDASAPQERFDVRRTSQNTDTHARIHRTRSLEDGKKERSDMRENRATRNVMSNMARQFTERTESQQRNARLTRDLKVNNRDEIIRIHRNVRMVERFEVHRQRDERRTSDRSLQRQSRDILARSTERRSLNPASRNGEIRFERLLESRDERKTNDRYVRNDIRVFKAVETRRDSRVTERENQHDSNMERKTNQHMRVEANLRSSDKVITKEARANTRYDRDAIDTRFRSFEAKVLAMEPVDGQSAAIWQMVFYALQGAYLCSLLIQVLTEKSNKGKSMNFSWWAVSKDLVKAD